jgi:hypothetical protein
LDTKYKTDVSVHLMSFNKFCCLLSSLESLLLVVSAGAYCSIFDLLNKAVSL